MARGGEAFVRSAGQGLWGEELGDQTESEIGSQHGQRERPRVVVVRKEVCGVRGKRPGNVGVRGWRSWAMVAKEEATGLG